MRTAIATYGTEQRELSAGRLGWRPRLRRPIAKGLEAKLTDASRNCAPLERKAESDETGRGRSQVEGNDEEAMKISRSRPRHAA